VNETLLSLIRTREADVKTFYTTSDPAAAQLILRKYAVKYVILGELEQVYYPGDGLTNIQAGLGGMLQKVFEYGKTQVYEVQPNPLLVTANPQ